MSWIRLKLSDARAWSIALAAVLSLAGLALAAREVDPGRLWVTLSRAQSPWLAAALASVAATLLAKAERWRGLFAAGRSPTLGRALAAQSVGMLLNALLPARLGDVARAAALGASQTEGAAYVLGTIALEKVAELLSLGAATLLLVSQIALPAWLPGWQIATVGVVVGLVALAVHGQSERLVGWVRHSRAVLPVAWSDWAAVQAHRGLAGLAALRQPRRLAAVAVWSLVIWALGALTNGLVWLALGLDWPPSAALALLVVLQAGVTIPAGLGRIGVFHALVVLCLGVYGIDPSLALAYAVILHLVVYAPIVVLGVVSVWREPTLKRSPAPAPHAGEAAP